MKIQFKKLFLKPKFFGTRNGVKIKKLHVPEAFLSFLIKEKRVPQATKVELGEIRKCSGLCSVNLSTYFL